MSDPYQFAQKFNIGDCVKLNRPYRVDYSDCDVDFDHDDSLKLVYEIPAGAEGEVVSGPNEFITEFRQGVRFFSEPNWPELYFYGDTIGSGHYIPTAFLESSERRNDDVFIAEGLEELYRF